VPPITPRSVASHPLWLRIRIQNNLFFLHCLTLDFCLTSENYRNHCFRHRSSAVSVRVSLVLVLIFIYLFIITPPFWHRMRIPLPGLLALRYRYPASTASSPDGDVLTPTFILQSTSPSLQAPCSLGPRDCSVRPGPSSRLS
jgi:hypothetical protein